MTDYQTIPLETTGHRKKMLAAVLAVTTLLVGLAIIIVYARGKASMEVFRTIGISNSLIFLIACSMLARLSTNRSGKIFAYGEIVLNVLYLAPLFVTFGQVVGKVVGVSLCFAEVWLVAILIRSNNLSPARISWIGLVPVLKLISFITIIFAEKMTMFAYLAVYAFFYMVRAVCWWHTVCSEAYNGEYDGDSEIKYSPFNKWVLVFFTPIVIALVIAAMAFLGLTYLKLNSTN